MADIHLVWLIDADPPSDAGGHRGFYPAVPDGRSPDGALMRARLDTMLEVIAGEAQGKAVVTVHTSPRFRDDFFREPYLAYWRALLDAGADLALHPHEDEADGSNLYRDLEHLGAVIGGCSARARALQLPFAAFRSGSFVFNHRLPPLLERAGIMVDLSALPGTCAPERQVDWCAGFAKARYLSADLSQPFASSPATRVLEIPIGWDGRGCDLGVNYLFNERSDLETLRHVWRSLRAASDEARPRLVNFLCHGFGLVEARWRDQAIHFLDHVREHGGVLIHARDAQALAPAARTSFGQVDEPQASGEDQDGRGA